MDDKTKDRYLRKKYGMTLQGYREELALHDGKCAICGKPPGVRSLHVDHDHGYRKIPVTKFKVGTIWVATAVYRGWKFWFEDPVMRVALFKLREALKANSIRGLICFPCNRTLRSGNNNAAVFESAARYLTSFENPVEVNPPPTSGEKS